MARISIAAVEAAQRSGVSGVQDVVNGLVVNVPTTIYEVSGDDTSGVAGLLLPSGEFIAKAPARSAQKYWNFDETLRYRAKREGESGARDVVGDSWTQGEVVWDGHAAPVAHGVEMTTDVYVEVEQKTRINAEGEETNTPMVIRKIEDVKVNVRDKDTNALTGDWITTGELWRALDEGRGMTQASPSVGRVHTKED